MITLAEMPSPSAIDAVNCSTENMRILVVEDQSQIASFIRKGLEEQGMVVD